MYVGLVLMSLMYARMIHDDRFVAVHIEYPWIHRLDQARLDSESRHLNNIMQPCILAASRVGAKPNIYKFRPGGCWQP